MVGGRSDEIGIQAVNVSVDSLLAGVPVSKVQGIRPTAVQSIVWDSRRAAPGSLFVAIKGAQDDGWAHVDDAIGRGCSAVVSEHDASLGDICSITVPNAREALAHLAAGFHGRPADALEMVGITGTNGKTTTAFLTYDLLQAAGRHPGLISTVEYRINGRSIPAERTTPPAPELHKLLAGMRDGGCRSAVMEVSSHALDQDRVAGIAFRAAVFTNLTRDHLDYHADVETYFDAKARLFESLLPGSAAVVNADDPRSSHLIERVPGKVDVLTRPPTSSPIPSPSAKPAARSWSRRPGGSRTSPRGSADDSM